MLKIYNTLTNKIEEFIPTFENKVKMYVCGPTVYDKAHLGHARCYITWDTLYRYLKFLGYDVTYCRNVTDVDDKILKKADEQGVEPSVITDKYYKSFIDSMNNLNVLRPDIEPRATKTLGEMIAMVKTLIEKGYNPLSFRFMCLNSHYRKQLVFSYDALDQAQKTLNKLRNKVNNIVVEGEVDSAKFDLYNAKFVKELENDLNTANSLSVLYEVLKDKELNGATKLELIKNFDKVFDLNLAKETNSVDSDLESYILEKIEERKEAKANKDYALADSIRDELVAKGIKLIDTKDGTTYELI